MFVVYDFHLGFSTPTDEYGSKEKVEATKLQESPLPAQSPVITTGRQFLSLFSLMCLQIYKYFCYYYLYNYFPFLFQHYLTRIINLLFQIRTV